MSGHTPGPWEVVDRRKSGIDAPIAWGVDKEDFGLAVFVPAAPWAFGKLGALIPTIKEGGEKDHYKMGEAQANAKLIAAAPELLEALKAYAEWHGPTCEHATRDDCPISECPGRPIDDAVNAAIAKAEGRMK